MQWLAALSVRRPVFATVLILSLTVVGIFSFTRLGVDRFPKVDLPTVLVTTVQPEPHEQVETEISDKIEEALNTIMASTSCARSRRIVAGHRTFLLDKDSITAARK
jgi:HAE1 family hydrophobic/amphiphilic exporter-1